MKYCSVRRRRRATAPVLVDKNSERDGRGRQGGKDLEGHRPQRRRFFQFVLARNPTVFAVPPCNTISALLKRILWGSATSWMSLEISTGPSTLTDIWYAAADGDWRPGAAW